MSPRCESSPGGAAGLVWCPPPPVVVEELVQRRRFGSRFPVRRRSTAFFVGATITIRRPCNRSAAAATFNIVVFPVPAGPVTVTSRSVPAMAAAASNLRLVKRMLVTVDCAICSTSVNARQLPVALKSLEIARQT